MLEDTVRQVARAVARPAPAWVHRQILDDFGPWQGTGIHEHGLDNFLLGRSETEARQYVRVKLLRGRLRLCFPGLGSSYTSWGACHESNLFLCVPENGSWGLCNSALPTFEMPSRADKDKILTAYNRMSSTMALPLLFLAARIQGAPHLPALDFIFFLGECDYWGGTPEAPVIAVARWDDKLRFNAVLVPWWEHLHDLSTEVSHRFRDPGLPWHQRRDVLFWRGKATKPMHVSATDSTRVKLVDLSARVGNRLGLDARFTIPRKTSARTPPRHDIWPARSDGYISGFVSAWDSAQVANTTHAPYAPPDEWRSYRYLMDIDGATYSGRLYWILHSGSLCFRPASGLRFWYHEVVRELCVAVADNLTDLAAKLARARRNPASSRLLAQRARDWARGEEGGQIAVYAYLWRALRMYASLQRFMPKV